MEHRKKVLVTGASQGIGKAIILELASRKYITGLHYYQDYTSAKEVADQITRMGGKCFLFKADLGNTEDVTQLATTAWKEMGGIDFLINNAGVSYKRHFFDTTIEDIDLFMNVNFKGTFLLTQLISKQMVNAETAGGILTVTSVNGITPGIGFGAYGASKAALEAMMKSIALDLSPYNITVNTLVLGAIESPTNQSVIQNIDVFNTVKAGIPLQRFGQGSEVANVVASLLESGSYMTGSSIVIDGGLLLMRGYGKPVKYQS